MTSISEHLRQIKDELPESVSLVAVSKFHPVEALRQAYDAGQRIFGESRAQEISQKFPLMPDDVQWHFIGHLQTNKVRMLVREVSLIHSVDSLKLLEVINSEGAKVNKVINVLLQLHVAQEDTKFGFSCSDCIHLVESGAISSLHFIRVCGVMGMATNTDDEVEIRKELRAIRKVFDTLKASSFADNPYFTEVSMGMSHDYKLAIEEGSTMVRIGTSIFGEREY